MIAPPRTATARVPVRLMTVGVWIAMLALFAAAVALGAHPRRAIDLKVYLLAAERFVDAAPLYRHTDGAMPFKYAPATAWLFAPLTLLPSSAAAVLWNLLSVTALWVTARLWFERLRTPAAQARGMWLGAVVALSHPLWLELHYAQVDLAMLLLLTVTLCTSERRPALAGIALALACLLKPPALLVALPLLVRRRWRALVVAAAAGASMFLPVVARYGAHGAIEAVQSWMSLTSATTAPWILGHNPQGLPTLLLSWFYGDGMEPAPAAMMAAQLVAAALFVAALAVARPRADATDALVLLGVALLSPLAWRANFVLAFPALLLALASKSRSGRAVVVIFALVGATVTPAWGDERFRSLMSARPFTAAAVLLFAWLLWRYRLGAQSPSPQTSENPSATLEWNGR